LALAAPLVATPDPSLAASPRRRGHGETILLVEDEDGVRDFSRRVLEREGYQVLAAALPSEACALFEQHTDEVDLLVTDVVMPDIDGASLAQKFLETRPRLRVLLMSGYSDFDSLAAVSTDGMRFLAKPFQAGALVTAVQQLLDA
jgi:two-component system, cell cycle sensor histidine kinase and response regulator CckA